MNKIFFAQNVSTIPLVPFDLLIANYNSTQINLLFTLPIGKSFILDWGDGNDVVVNGNDGIIVSVTSIYASANSYPITLIGEYLELTLIDCGLEDVSGDISSWSALINLSFLSCLGTSVSGDISSWSALTALTEMSCNNTDVSGDISSWSLLINLAILYCHTTDVSGDISSWVTLTALTKLYCNTTDVSGDISSWSVLISLSELYCHTTNVSGDISSWVTLINLTRLRSYSTSVDFDSATAWVDHNHIVRIYDCLMNSTQVDNMLIAFAGGSFVEKNISIAGNNAARTSDSDAAKASLLANDNIIDVNE